MPLPRCRQADPSAGDRALHSAGATDDGSLTRDPGMAVPAGWADFRKQEGYGDNGPRQDISGLEEIRDRGESRCPERGCHTFLRRRRSGRG